VNEPILKLHVSLAKALRELHRCIPVEGALIQEEGWVLSLPPGPQGLLLAADVALAGKLEGDRLGDLFRLMAS
jgi:hypothetical protein